MIYVLLFYMSNFAFKFKSHRDSGLGLLEDGMLDAVLARCSIVKFFFLFVCGSNRVFGGIPTGKHTNC